jgi:hypothetical protein
MCATWHNPYRRRTGRWIRGNFHTHCRENSGCGTVPLSEVVRKYHQIGAGFIAMTDHDTVTDLYAMRAAYPELILFEGFEHSQREHLLFVGRCVPPLHKLSLEEALTRAGELLTILCHPQPRRNQEYWSREKVVNLGRLPDGMEIYDGHYGVQVKIEEGTGPQYTHVWDEFLTAGLRLWGFASDDFHDPEDFDNGFNMVRAPKPSPASVLQAVKQGNFYATTGLLLEEVAERSGTIQVKTSDSCVGRFVGPGAKVLAEGKGRFFEFTATDETYVRFEGEGKTGKIFLQPMFREEP